MNMKQYETFELRFGGEVLPDAWAQIDLTATFSCAQESLTVKGFYDGESDGRGVYVVRFLPQYAGVYRYQVRGAVTAEGEIVCEASSPEAHGIVRAVGTHFAFADGAPYIPFGTTVYALISQDDALVEQTLQSLAAAPFNKLRLCVFPKDYDYNHNEPPLYAFARREDGSWDTSRPSIAFYQRLERILRRMAVAGSLYEWTRDGSILMGDHIPVDNLADKTKVSVGEASYPVDIARMLGMFDRLLCDVAEHHTIKTGDMLMLPLTEIQPVALKRPLTLDITLGETRVMRLKVR